MRILAVVVLLLASAVASATEPYHTENIMLLQPEFVLQERVPSVNQLSDYIKAVQNAAGLALSGKPQSPTSGQLVIAVRPGGQSKVWLDFVPALPEPTASALRQALEAVPPFQAQGGVVVFSLNSILWGAPPSSRPPAPAEWTEAMKGRTEPEEIGSLVERVWPPKAGT
jgi:hypothetical protein